MNCNIFVNSFMKNQNISSCQWADVWMTTNCPTLYLVTISRHCRTEQLLGKLLWLTRYCLSITLQREVLISKFCFMSCDSLDIESRECVTWSRDVRVLCEYTCVGDVSVFAHVLVTKWVRYWCAVCQVFLFHKMSSNVYDNGVQIMVGDILVS